MTLTPEGFRAPRRLVIKALLATFGAMAAVLVIVFVTVLADTRVRVTRAVTANLDAGQRVFATLERERQTALVAQTETLAESPTLKAALDTYQLEARAGRSALTRQLVATVRNELEKISTRLPQDAVVVTDLQGRVVAAAGPHSTAWTAGDRVDAVIGLTGARDLVIEQPVNVFRVIAVPLRLASDTIGALLLTTALDNNYARRVSELSRARNAIVLNGRVLASTLDPARRLAFEAQIDRLPEEGVITLDGDLHAVRLVSRVARAEFYAVDSIGMAAAAAHQDALDSLSVIAIGALVLGALASFWLARALSRPIDGLSQQLRLMARAREFSRSLPPSGSSRELDALTDTFNELMASLLAAESQTQQAYLGAIKALAAALDARDTYTAGHSERVSALSLLVGRQLRLDEQQMEVLRLGALLHDIGKIGIRDRVLTKNGPLTDDEFEIIKTHPSVGAHILRQVPFLAAHVPIVELHHEQPDGRGYPHGLLGHATPLLARIVHVADAFDAMTSARAYRPAQSAAYALAELRRYRGSQFDAEVVDAFLAAWEQRPDSDLRSDLAAIAAGAAPTSQSVLTPAAGQGGGW
jgi:putative nucleotidyltransferase with HDIG domain